MKIELDVKKFQELVLYICDKADPSKLGATKLNKVLWYSDVFSYLYLDKPMTGETYIKRQYGPAPKHILDAIDSLQFGGSMCVRDSNFFGYTKKEYLSLKKPELSLFSAEEISLVDRIIAIICENHTAVSISEKTHDRIWELAEIGEEIPYYAILASSLGEIDESDIEWAKSVKKAA